jgi:hypothetical protein
VLLPFKSDPVAFLEELGEKDPRFHRSVCRWLARFLVPAEIAGVYKFKQARRAGEALRRLMVDSERERVLVYSTKICSHYATEDEEDEELED